MRKKRKTSTKSEFSKVKRLTAISSTVMFLFGTICNAAIFAPEWTEFCPPRYCDSNENAFSKDATYWYKRRVQFNRAIEKCSSYKGSELDNCYSELREAEARKNKVWDVRQDEKYRTTEYNREYYMEKMKYDGVNRIIETIKK